jgi:hypothetical protein
MSMSRGFISTRAAMRPFGDRSARGHACRCCFISDGQRRTMAPAASTGACLARPVESSRIYAVSAYCRSPH